MQTNIYNNSDIGLNHGLAGEAFLYLIMGKKTGNKILQMHGELALDSVGSKLANYSDFSFSNGIVGIGWMIEFCAQNGLLKIDSDDILEDVDDKIYQVTLITLSKNLAEFTEILDLITYYELRLLKKNSGAHYYRRFTHLECLILLIEYCQKKLEINILSKNNDKKHFNEVALVLLKFSHLTSKGFSDTHFEDIFYESMEFFITHFEPLRLLYLEHLPEAPDIVELYMLLCMTARQYNNPYWISELELCYKQLQKEFSSHTNKGSDFCEKIALMELIFHEPVINENLFNSIVGNQKHTELLTFYLSNYQPFSLGLI